MTNSDIRKYEYVNTLCTKIGESGKPVIHIKILKKQVQGLLDSGATISILNQQMAKTLKHKGVNCRPEILLFKTADGAIHRSTKSLKLQVEFANKTAKVKFHIAPYDTPGNIFGINFWDAFDIRPAVFYLSTSSTLQPTKPLIHVVNNINAHNLTEEQEQLLSSTKLKFKIADGKVLGFTPIREHVIDTENALPVKQKQYHSSPYVQEKINIEIDRMLRLGIIEPAKSPSWLNPIIPVKKSDGSVRLCLDARKLNERTVKNAFPQQNLNRILEQMKGCKFISTIDLKDAYYQVKIEPSSRPCTAFSVSSKGTYQYVRMANGLCNASSTLRNRTRNNRL